MKTFPVTKASALGAAEPESHWLINDLWGEEAVGILGGEPKWVQPVSDPT